MITVYSLDCPKCLALKKRLTDKGIDFTLIENRDEVVKVASKFGITDVPFMTVDDKAYDFLGAVDYIDNL